MDKSEQALKTWEQARQTAYGEAIKAQAAYAEFKKLVEAKEKELKTLEGDDFGDAPAYAEDLKKRLAALKTSGKAEAVQRAVHLRKWLDANNDAISAVSPYKTAIENFVKNQAEQFSHKSIQAAINVLQAGAGFAGMAVPFAAPVAAGLSVAATLEELTYKYYKEASLKAVWQKTKQALENPGNRKIALIARKMNPALAKYTIAYGAVVEKDVVAITAVNRCGLTREVLADKDSNVSAVKKYMETLYPDDGKALGEYDDGDWRKKLPPPALDVMNWSLAYETTKKSGGPQDANPRAIVGQLKSIAKLEPVVRGKPEEKDFQDLEAALKTTAQAIGTLKPSDAKVKEFFGRYADLAEIRLAEVEEARAEP